MKDTQTKKNKGSASTFKIGAIALAFLLIGYQAALFMHRASVLHAESVKVAPDTVIIYRSVPAASAEAPVISGTASAADEGRPIRQHPDSIERRPSELPRELEQVLVQRRPAENFKFNPNTVSVSDLQRLGFSEKQAMSIDAYRAKGGRFRRKEDFARSYVVADSVFKRLEPYIDIPKIDINKADSAAFDTLPGIGGWFAARMVEYRTSLGGYSFPEQLLDIYHFDREKYDALSDLICCSRPMPFELWTLPAEKLREHPYIHDWNTARAIVLFRQNNPSGALTVQALADAGILNAENAGKMARCVIAPPPGSSDDGTGLSPAR